MDISDSLVFVSPELLGARGILPTNTCFDDALDYVDTLRKMGMPRAECVRFYIVHGICLWPGDQPGTEHRKGERFAHAWVERDEVVIQAGLHSELGHRGWYGLRKQAFLDHLQVQQQTRYTVEEALHENWRANHYGPWLPEYAELCRARPR